MIDDIRNWLGDMASGKIKDAHLALSEAQNMAFLRDLEKLDSERDGLLAENRTLKQSLADAIAENRILAVKLAEAVATDDRMPEPQAKILKVLHQRETLSTEEIASLVGLSAPDTKGHLDALVEGDYAQWDLNASQRGKPTLGHFYITGAGRAEVMKRG